MLHSNVRRSRGFTLIELLVVIAIIAILVALLLPAVQQVREAARKSQCQDHLHNLGTALHTYESSAGVLPPGSVYLANSAPSGANRLGAFVFILPFIEQKPAYDLWDLNVTQEHANNQAGNRVAVPLYFCPSVTRTAQHNSSNQSVGDYALSSGTAHCNSASHANWRGVFNQNSNIGFHLISDGTSNVFMIGEKRISDPKNTGLINNPIYRWGWNSTRNTTSPMNQDIISAAWDDNDANFGGPHAGGCMFVFGDAAVRFLSENIDRILYRNLSDRADGNPVKVP